MFLANMFNRCCHLHCQLLRRRHTLAGMSLCSQILCSWHMQGNILHCALYKYTSSYCNQSCGYTWLPVAVLLELEASLVCTGVSPSLSFHSHSTGERSSANPFHCCIRRYTRRLWYFAAAEVGGGASGGAAGKLFCHSFSVGKPF